MTKPERDEAESSQAVAAPANPAEKTAKPAPEPWTPERVLAWNRYLDRYVAGGVLLLVFLSCIRPIVSSSIWTLLRAGERISSGAPITSDTLSYTRSGQPWVNIPWLFEVANWQIYSAVEGLFTSNDNPAQGPFAAASALVLVSALIVTLAAWLLMSVRRPGPGLWWSAICVMLALGGCLQPFEGGRVGVSIRGIYTARPVVESESWGLLLLALEIFLVHRAANLGRTKALWGLPFVFALWSNIDESFVFGLIVLAAWTLGLVVSKLASRGDAPPVSIKPAQAGLVFAICTAATLANPSLHQPLLAGLATLQQALMRLIGRPTGLLTTDQLSYFDRESQNVFDNQHGRGTATGLWIYFVIVVWAGLFSFLVNWRRFSLPRLLAYLAAVFLWAMLERFAGLFAAVFATTLALNGQEWYHDRYGVKGRVGAGWKLWSDGGRALAILGIFFFITIAITGHWNERGAVPFGLGVDDSNLPFHSADFIRELGLKGEVLNLSLDQGDAILWRDPARKSFIDTRKGVFPESQRDDLAKLRAALRKDDKPAWEEILAKYSEGDPGITALIVAPDQGRDAGIFESLSRSPYWVLLYDGGNSVVFGRVDKPGPDQELFTQKRLDADEVVYKRDQPLLDWERPPTPTGFMDQVLHYRNMRPTKPQVYAGTRWLVPVGDTSGLLLEPSRYLMAVREARNALLGNPDDHNAYRLLQVAYRALMQSEARILQTNATSALEPSQYLAFRFRQRAAALNFAIQTTPPPQSREDKGELAELHVALATMFQGNSAIDLERDQLQAARDQLKGDFPLEIEQRLAQLNEQVEQFRNDLDRYTDETQAGPMQRAQLAAQNGFPGIAIEELQAAENAGVSLSAVRWNLLDLYCQSGQPDKAYELLESTTANDPSLATGPGTAAYRQGLVNLLLGNYELAGVYWSLHAIPPIRAMQSYQAITAARSWLRGQPIPATRSLLEVAGIPGSPGLLESQAEWEAELGLSLLEAGVPQDVKDAAGNVVKQGAVTHLQNALTINPAQPLRPLLEYYIQKLGGTVPSAPSPADSADPITPESTPETAAPAPANTLPQ